MEVFDFSDYRAYLKSWIRHLPKSGRGEISKIAERLRVHPTAISQTLSGVRDITEEQAQEMTEYIGLGEFESEYFLMLVRVARASTPKYRAHLKSQLAKLKNESRQISKRVAHDRQLTELERSIFYSSYLYSAIRLYCAIGKGQTIESIAAKFDISRQQAQTVAKFLLQIGLISEASVGVYVLGPAITMLDQGSPYVSRHHANWRLKALQRSEQLSEEELMFSGPISISKKDFSAVREILVRVIKQVSTIVRDSKAEEVGCINLDLIWIEK